MDSRSDDRRLVSLLMLAVGAAAANAAAGALLTFLVDYCIEVGLSSGSAGALLAAASGTAVAVRLTLGLLADRRPDAELGWVVALLGLGATGYALLTTSVPALIAFGAILAVGLACCGCQPAANRECRKQAIAKAKTVRGDAARLGRSVHLCLCKTPGQDGLAAVPLLVRSAHEISWRHWLPLAEAKQPRPPFCAVAGPARRRHETRKRAESGLISAPTFGFKASALERKGGIG
jgi:hypothetical protein